VDSKGVQTLNNPVDEMPDVVESEWEAAHTHLDEEHGDDGPEWDLDRQYPYLYYIE
jgi:hypothetical protein